MRITLDPPLSFGGWSTEGGGTVAAGDPVLCTRPPTGQGCRVRGIGAQQAAEDPGGLGQAASSCVLVGVPRETWEPWMAVLGHSSPIPCQGRPECHQSNLGRLPPGRLGDLNESLPTSTVHWQLGPDSGEAFKPKKLWATSGSHSSQPSVLLVRTLRHQLAQH